MLPWLAITFRHIQADEPWRSPPWSAVPLTGNSKEESNHGYYGTCQSGGADACASAGGIMGALPLDRWSLFHSTDLDLARELVGQLFVPHQLHLLERQARLDARMNSVRLFDISLNTAAYGCAVHVEPGELGTFHVILIPLAGNGLVRTGRDEVQSTPALASIVSPFDYLDMRLSGDCVLLICRLEHAALQAYLSDLLGTRPRKPLRFSPGMPTDRTGLSVPGAVQDLATELDRRDTLATHQLVLHHAEQHIITTLLATQPSNYTEALHATVTPANPREVDLAVGLLEAHPERPWSLGSLARKVGVSGRTLERGLRTHLNTTFTELLTGIRMRRVHDTLRSTDPDVTSVIDTFTTWGLDPTGHTYVAYRRSYGATPAETLHH